MKRFLIMLLTLFAVLSVLCSVSAESGENPVLTEGGLAIGTSRIAYPVLEGLRDTDVQAAVNRMILQACEADVLLAKLPLYMSSGTPLCLTWSGGIRDGILSVAMQATGPVGENDRLSEKWSALNVDLRTGEAIPLAQLFASPDTGLSFLEEYLQDSVLPELSAHLENCELLPVPDSFSLSETGLTLYYPMERLSTLTGKAGAVSLCWYELLEELDLSDDGILRRIGAVLFLNTGDNTGAYIADDCEKGFLHGIPAVIGEPLKALTDRYGLLTDPDLSEGGRVFSLEGADWRGTSVLTDALQEKRWDDSVVQGFRCDRISLYGIITGLTRVEEWREILGEPGATAQIDAEQAESWRIVPGTSDYYYYGEYVLRLHADENGILTTVFLT